MPFTSNDGTIGFQQAGDIFVPDTTQRFTLGQVLEGEDPFFGWGKFIYGKAGAAIALPGRLNFFDYQYSSTDIPNTANLGQPFFVNKAQMAISTYGWFQVAGLIPVQTAASVAIGVAVGIGAAGQAGTNTAGKQLLNTRVVQPSTYAPTLAGCVSTNGSPFLTVPNVNGLFIGLTASGTGISGTITAIDPSQNRITLSANATATGAITATFTWTNFLLLMVNHGFTQGAIT